MARADLHNALVLDREIYDASLVDATLLDPIVRTSGALPGPARPFVVVREYQGPQGAYTEQFVITDALGRQVVRSPQRRVELGGEMAENRFVDTLTDVRLSGFGEHAATFLVDGEEVGTIPVFVEAAHGGDPRVAAEETFKKAVQKGSILWLTVPQPPARRRRRRGGGPSEHTQPVWFVYEGGKVYVFSGPTEQNVPLLPEASEVTLTARSKDLRSEVSKVRASVRVVPVDDPLWQRVARAGLARRLNLPDGDGALDRWRANCVLVELTPLFGDEPVRARPVAPRAAAPAQPASASDLEEAEAPAAAPAPAEEEPKVEAQIDQEVYDRLTAEGKPERIARAKAKAAYVRAEKARLRAEAGEKASLSG